MSIYSFKQQKSVSNYGSIKEFLESESGMINSTADRDQWDDFYGTDNLDQSNETQPTASSLEKMTTKYNPKHYQRGSIQVWDFIVDQQLDFLAGNIIKYICRAGHKDYESELDDWLKVKAYVERKIKQISQERNR
jgi:hypothetical protein